MRTYQTRTIRRHLRESLGSVTEEVNTNIIPIVNVNAYDGWVDDLLGMEYEDMSDTYYDGEEVPMDEWEQRRDSIFKSIARTAESCIQRGFDYLQFPIKVVRNSAKFYFPNEYNYSNTELDFTVTYDLDWFNGAVKYLSTDERFELYISKANPSRVGFISRIPSTVEDFVKCASNPATRWKALSCVCSYYIDINKYEIEDLQRDFEEICYENA